MADAQDERTESLAGAAALITAARTVQILVIFALTIPLTRLLSKPEYGVYAHMVFLAAVVPTAFSAAAGRTVAFFVPRSTSPTRLLRGVGLALGCVFVMAGGAIAFVPEVLASLDPSDALLVSHRHVIGAIVATTFPFAVAEQVMLARGRAREFASVMLLVAAALLVAVGGALAFAPPEFRLGWALRGHLAATGVQAVAGIAALFVPMRAADDSGRRAVRGSEVAAFATPLLGAALLGLLATRLDGFWIPRFFGELKPEYLRGAMELPVVGALAVTVLNLTAPRLSRLDAMGDRGALLDLWRRSCRLVGLVTIPVVGAVLVVADDLFLTIYPAYDRGVPVFRWYLLLLVVRVFLPGTLLESTGAPRRALASSAAHLGASFVALVGLTAWWGWHGVAPAMVVGAFVGHWLIGGHLARRHLETRWSALLDWRWLATMLVVASVSGAISTSVVGLDALASWPRLARAAMGSTLFVASFGVASRLAGLWSNADVDRLRAALSRR